MKTYTITEDELRHLLLANGDFLASTNLDTATYLSEAVLGVANRILLREGVKQSEIVEPG